MLETKIRELLEVPKQEPEPLTQTRIIQGIQWYDVYGNKHLADEIKALLIAEHLAKEYKYNLRK